MHDLPEFVLERARAEEPVFNADEVAAWPDGLLDQLVGDGALKATSNALSVTCDACGHDHVETVEYIESPPGAELRAYISCPENGRVRVPLSRLRRWILIREKLPIPKFRFAGSMCDIPIDPPGPGDDHIPNWLEAASLSPDAILAKCEAWHYEAVMRASDTPQMNDGDWAELCETIRVIASGKGMDVCSVVEFEQVCTSFGSPSQKSVFDKIGPADVVVEALADSAKIEISRRVSQRTESSRRGESGSNKGAVETATQSRESPEYLFRRTGDFWRVQYQNEAGTFKVIDGMVYIARLLVNPHKKISAYELKCAAGHDSSSIRPPAAEVCTEEASMTIETPQDITDEKTVKACQARLPEIEDERSSAREAGDIEKLEELEEEEQKIQQFLSTTKNIRGGFRTLGDKQRSVFNSVKQAIGRAINNMKTSNPPMPKLVEHFDKYLEWGDGAFEYRPKPPTPDWQF